jgi:TPR repeat protein
MKYGYMMQVNRAAPQYMKDSERESQCEGNEESLRKAAQLFREAADDGDAPAQGSDASLLETSQGIVKYLQKMTEYYKVAIDKEFDPVIFDLSRAQKCDDLQAL